MNVDKHLKGGVKSMVINANIDWGAGKISRGCWLNIKRVLKEYNIRTLLEFGSGLSTELFSLEDLDEVWSLDILEPHFEKMRAAVPGVKFIHYEKGHVPEINRKFDMVFVDGPSGDRSKELTISNEVALKVIYCHDWGRRQETVKLDGRWKMSIKNKVFVSI